MNREQIKLTAIAAMTVNHTAIALVPPDSIVYTIMTDIGYLTAVTMCYFLVEGYYHTRSKMGDVIKEVIYRKYARKSKCL